MLPAEVHRVRAVSRILLSLACLAAPAGVSAEPAAPPGDAGNAADHFARALQGSNAGMIGAMLPDQGKIRLRLRRLGPEEGAFSGRQVESLFRDFFRGGIIRSAKVEGVDQQSGTYALGRVRATGVDAEGRPLDFRLHLGFQLENDRWALREIRETPP